MVVAKNDKEKKKKKEKEEMPDLWFIFDERGEYHGDIANKAIMVKQGDQHDDILEFAGKLGKVSRFQYNSIVKDVDDEEAKSLFEEEGYIITQATSQDFEEIKRELDKLETIEGGESKKYK